MACGLKTSLLLVKKLICQVLTKLGFIYMPAVVAADPEAPAQLRSDDGAAVGNPKSERAEIMLAVCFTAAIDIAILSPQIHAQLPISFLFVSLAILFAFSAFFMTIFLASSKLTKAALVLERAGVFFVVTGFFIAVSISFPLCLKVVTWVFYAVCLLVLLGSYFFG